jgi:hypothetical protein
MNECTLEYNPFDGSWTAIDWSSGWRHVMASGNSMDEVMRRAAEYSNKTLCIPIGPPLQGRV